MSAEWHAFAARSGLTLASGSAGRESMAHPDHSLLLVAGYLFSPYGILDRFQERVRHALAVSRHGPVSGNESDLPGAGYTMSVSKVFCARLSLAVLLLATACIAPLRAEPPADKPWARVIEDDRAIKIETDKLEAVIPKKNPKQWMTGIEKESFLDKTTGFREIGDGLMVIDWLMEAGSDEAWSEKVIAPDGNGVGRYTWFANETDPGRRSYALMAHGNSHRKRVVEGPQLCHRMKPVEPVVLRGKDFVAVTTTYQY